MVAAKTNERPGTKASLQFARFSAYKAREVLNLIRGLHVKEAREVLMLLDRGAAEPIIKLLDSAVANAANNDHISADELVVSACYADEGPTLKRFRPRARGSASRIRKRTCHITIIVSRMTATELDERNKRNELKGKAKKAAPSRADRVAKSKKSGEKKSAQNAADGDANDVDVDEASNQGASSNESATDESATQEIADDAATDTDASAETDADAPDADATEAEQTESASEESAEATDEADAGNAEGDK